MQKKKKIHDHIKNNAMFMLSAKSHIWRVFLFFNILVILKKKNWLKKFFWIFMKFFHGKFNIYWENPL